MRILKALSLVMTSIALGVFIGGSLFYIQQSGGFTPKEVVDTLAAETTTKAQAAVSNSLYTNTLANITFILPENTKVYEINLPDYPLGVYAQSGSLVKETGHTILRPTSLQFYVLKVDTTSSTLATNKRKLQNSVLAGLSLVQNSADTPVNTLLSHKQYRSASQLLTEVYEYEAKDLYVLISDTPTNGQERYTSQQVEAFLKSFALYDPAVSPVTKSSNTSTTQSPLLKAP